MTIKNILFQKPKLKKQNKTKHFCGDLCGLNVHRFREMGIESKK